MAQIITAALVNAVVERDMPKGYTWVKVLKCWSGDPVGGRFFAPKTTEFGDEIPAAYFTTIIVYDRDMGLHERDIKFIGDEAEALNFALSVANQIALISTEGHLTTKTYEMPGGKEIAKTIIMAKRGSTRIYEIVPQGSTSDSCSIEEAANRTMREVEPQRQIDAQTQGTGIRDANPNETVWPGLTDWIETGDIDPPDFDAKSKMDEAPF